MSRNILICLILALTLATSVNIASAQEPEKDEIIFTTYYPAPYGVYNAMSTNKLRVGNTGADPDTYANDGDMVVDNDLTVKGTIIGSGGGENASPNALVPGLNADFVDGKHADDLGGGTTDWSTTTAINAGGVYQNGNTRAILVVALGYFDHWKSVSANIKTDSSNPPTTEKAKFSQISHTAYEGPAGYGTMTVPIQPNDYYLVTVGSNTYIARAELFY